MISFFVRKKLFLKEIIFDDYLIQQLKEIIRFFHKEIQIETKYSAINDVNRIKPPKNAYSAIRRTRPDEPPQPEQPQHVQQEQEQEEKKI